MYFAKPTLETFIASVLSAQLGKSIFTKPNLTDFLVWYYIVVFIIFENRYYNCVDVIVANVCATDFCFYCVYTKWSTVFDRFSIFYVSNTEKQAINHDVHYFCIRSFRTELKILF